MNVFVRMEYCDELECCSKELFGTTGKCFNCFLSALGSPKIYREWMTQYGLQLPNTKQNGKQNTSEQEENPIDAFNKEQKEPLECAFCRETISMIIEKLKIVQKTKFCFCTLNESEEEGSITVFETCC